MKDTILKFLKEKQGRRYSIRGLYDALGFEGGDAYKELAKAVNALEEEARIMPDNRNRYTLLEYSDYAVGALDVKDRGFAFLLSEVEDEDDIYIPPHKLHNAMNGDRALVAVERSPKGFKKEGEVVRILRRETTHLVGTLIQRGGRYFLLPDDGKLKNEIIVPKDKRNGAKDKEKVQAEIINYAFKEQTMVCKVTRRIGNVNEPGVDVTSKVLSFGIEPEFPKKALKQAARHQSVDADEAARRKDLRERDIVTIDGADAKDFDDAVEVKRLEDGGFFLGVHIADVSHYVTENSPLDEEAYRRGTSIYLVDRVIPMLPEDLSNNLCSLMPDVDRLAVSCDMWIDAEGRVKHHEIYESVIRSSGRLTYEQVNAALSGDAKAEASLEGLMDMVREMRTLAKLLRQRRTERGSLHFETEEPVISLDDAGRAIDVRSLERGESERFIEEFMLVANRTVAEHVYWMELPFLYRVHEEPKEEKLEKLLTMANALGLQVRGRKTIAHKELQKLLQKVEDTVNEKGINMMMLRAMQKAVYKAQNLGHFGLAFEHYTHFTSPIRRYPDLIVHRLLRKYFFHSRPKTSTLRRYEKKLPQIAEASSEKERNAIALERDVNDMKKAEYMQPFIGETFEGHISGVTGFGLYVSLPCTVEGLIHIGELDDDYYVFDEEHLLLVGRHKKRVFRMGDTIRVKLTGVNVFDGELNFTVAKGD